MSSSCVASSSSVLLRRVVPVPQTTTRAASTISGTNNKPKAEGKNTARTEPSLIIGSEARSQVFQGSTRTPNQAARASYKGKEKATRSSTAAGSPSRKPPSSQHRLKTSSILRSQQNDTIAKQVPTNPSAERDQPDQAHWDQIAEEEAQRRDELASAQDRLRSFFSKTRTSSSLPSSVSNELSSPSALDAYPFEDKLDWDAEFSQSHSDLENDGFSGSVVSADSISPRSFSRPTLDQLHSAEMDQFAGFYQSRTAWNPDKDYALMPDGPERESILRRELEKGHRQYIVVILDGDNLLFDPSHLRRGYEGGKFVYEELRQRIAQKHRLIPQKLDLRIRFFCSLNALATTLHKLRMVNKELLFDFLRALTDGSLHNYIVNVGRGDQAADLRVKAALADAIQDPGCFRAYLGGLDDFGYKEDLQAIHEMGLLEKKVHLVQVPGYAVESKAYGQYAHRAIDLDYLFKNQAAAIRAVEKYVSGIGSCLAPRILVRCRCRLPGRFSYAATLLTRSLPSCFAGFITCVDCTWTLLLGRHVDRTMRPSMQWMR